MITSLPDVSEVPALGFDGWRTWFEYAAMAVMAAVPDDGVAIFFQTDIRREGVWVDKGTLVAAAAAKTGMELLFHKIVCRLPPGTATFGRASFSHLLGFGRQPRPVLRGSADVLSDAGFKPGTKSMGVNACLEACRFVLAETPSRTIVDPFCGLGTVLAVANALGMEAIGVDLSVRMVRKAQLLRIDPGHVPGRVHGAGAGR